MARADRYDLTASFNSATKTSDGAGGYYVDYTSEIVSSWSCMEATMSANDRDSLVSEHGLESDARVRRFVGEYNASIVEQIVLVLSGIKYRVLSVRHPKSFGDPVSTEIVVAKLKL